MYDANGNLKSAASGISVWSANYNFRNMLTSETSNLNNGQFNWVLGYTHDGYGHVSTVTYPTGEVVSYVPNPRGFDATAGSYAGTIAYNPDGSMASAKFGNGINGYWNQNARLLPGSLIYGMGGVAKFQETYTYDANANLTAVADQINGQNNQTLGYDALNRLTSASAPNAWGNQTYAYDPLNRLRQYLNGYTFNINFDANSRLASLTVGGNTFSSYTSDARGNRATTTYAGATGSYSFDAENQLLAIPGTESYAYDAAGRRVMKTPASGGAASAGYSFYNHAGQLMMGYSAATGLFTNYIYLNGKLIARHAGSTTTYLLTDRLGTPVREADVNGNVTASFSYEPFGIRYSGPNQGGPAFTGHENDPETAFTYMQARYYDAGVGGFLSVDPIAPTPGDVFNFSRYAYASNNPIVHTDSDGKDAQNVVDQFREAIEKYAVSTVENIGHALVTDTTNVVKSDLQAHTYTGSVGLSGTVAAPLGAPFVSPSIGLTGSVSYSLNSHGQSAVNASIAPLAGSGGGATAGVAFGAARTEGGAAPGGFSIGYTNHVEGDFSVPGQPISFGLSADWNKDGFTASSGVARLSYGPIIFAGGGKQINASYTFKKDDDSK